MKKTEQKEHPELTDLKNICDIIPNEKTTKNICNTLNTNRKKVGLSNGKKTN